ncbi:MAG TPA: MltA domain-containing protein [Alphaproteobacteria bacterium]|nr:MltA domain-containing protein [Alphaproteobacteria bacterium]
MTGRLAGLLFLLAVIVAALVTLMIVQPEPPVDRLVLEPRAYVKLDGWAEDDHAPALDAFRKSCARLLTFSDEASLGANGIAGTVADWRAACEAAMALNVFSADDARRFFQTWFRAVAIQNNSDDLGLFTGYYEPVLEGSRTRNTRFDVPVYPRPEGHLTVELGAFRESLAGQRLVGRLEGSRLVPVETRAEIDAGALDDGPEPLLWLDSAVDAFFMQIQGSARIDLENGTTVRVGYAGSNGHPYTAIGRVLVARGALAEDEVSAQSIRAWLEANPGEAAAVMQENESFVFFRLLEEDGPVGAQGVVLTPGRSLALDRRWLPLGVPVFVDTTVESGDSPARVRRLMVAQDVGGAIKGIVRGDVYWGSGDAAGEIAGRMKQFGRYFALLPRTLLERRARKEN